MNLSSIAPRLRMFAGPNGSGKSTIKSVIRQELLGIYINPDEIEAHIKKNDFLDFGDLKSKPKGKKFSGFFAVRRSWRKPTFWRKPKI